jgi:hypothetical protein
VLDNCIYVCRINGEQATRARFSIPSIIAIIAAIASFAVGAFWGFVLAMIAVACGLIGVIVAFSSRIRGGFVSAFAILAGMVGLAAAIIKGIAWLF